MLTTTIIANASSILYLAMAFLVSFLSSEIKPKKTAVFASGFIIVKYPPRQIPANPSNETVSIILNFFK